MTQTRQAYGFFHNGTTKVHKITLASSVDEALAYFSKGIPTDKVSAFNVQPLLISIDPEPVTRVSDTPDMVTWGQFAVLRYANLVVGLGRHPDGARRYAQYQALLFINKNHTDKRCILMWKKPYSHSPNLHDSYFDYIVASEGWLEPTISRIAKAALTPATKSVSLGVFEYSDTLMRYPGVLPITRNRDKSLTWGRWMNLPEFGNALGIESFEDFGVNNFNEFEELLLHHVQELQNKV